MVLVVIWNWKESSFCCQWAEFARSVLQQLWSNCNLSLVARTCIHNKYFCKFSRHIRSPCGFGSNQDGNVNGAWRNQGVRYNKCANVRVETIISFASEDGLGASSSAKFARLHTCTTPIFTPRTQPSAHTHTHANISFGSCSNEVSMVRM